MTAVDTALGLRADPAGCAVSVQGLCLRTSRGTVFEGVSFDAAAGQVVAIAGASGTGRTALLLALSGRMKFKSGVVAIDGREFRNASGAVRKLSTFGPGHSIGQLEYGLKAREEARRAVWLAGKRARLSAGEVMELAGLEVNDPILIRDMSALQTARFAIACAFADRVPLVFIDDVGYGVPAHRHLELWDLIVECTRRTGSTVIASTLEPKPAEGRADVICGMGSE